MYGKTNDRKKARKSPSRLGFSKSEKRKTGLKAWIALRKKARAMF